MDSAQPLMNITGTCDSDSDDTPPDTAHPKVPTPLSSPPITERQAIIQRILRLFQRTLLPDTLTIPRLNDTSIPSTHVLPLKFFLITYLLTLFSHWWIRQNPSWGYNPSYTLQRFHLYDFNEVLLDSLWFYVVGRWWDKKGVDSPQFILTTLLRVYFFGILDTFDWAKYSITSYDIMCRWPWQLFLFTSFIILLASFLTCLHVIKAYHDKILLGRLSEIFLCVCVFILPIATDSSTHYHHWFTAWFIGQHANQKYWWSVSCSALLWGGYINGIASWGRGAMLGCKEGFWMVVGSQYCTFMECYFDVDDDINDDVDPSPSPIIPNFIPTLDWRNCSAT
ncbi:hypothetical protein TrST_g11171 [Triparma strigata]|uniref:Uncharacterized protein n=1 Tax=Triparma strigata TaxID=1606541 RepID=A0A9W7BEQ5_9STRA|nr:hypothetical protein TrST_g11171 [Triparma strigata]